jgi:predicted dehydrogenase|tara:strand:- start:3958 stop:4941 length:984 start_codon:yes stop_codon:yes gene_type:complete
MNKKLGLVGCGYWGPNIVRNIQKTQNIDLEFVVDQDEAVINKLPPVSFYQDLDSALVRHGNVDGVIIATPISTHFTIAKQILEAGKSVLIQKPMAMSVEECEELEEIAKSKGLTLMIAHTFLFTGAVRKLKELADSGQIGNLKHFDSTRINLGLFQRDSNVVWDLAPHDFSILHYLIGDLKPVFLSAVGSSHTPKGNADVVNISIQYENNFSAHIHISWFSPIKVRNIILNGDQKMVVYNDNKPSEKVMVYDKGVSYEDSYFDYRSGDMFAPKLKNSEAIQEEVLHFCECMDGVECISGPKLGKQVVELIEAANKSIELMGEPVFFK